MQAELILRGGPIRSAHNGWRPAEALALAGGRVAAFGSEAEVAHTAGPGTRFIDLNGRVAVPGLIDAHVHILWYALSLDMVQLAGLPSLSACAESVRQAAACRPAGSWVYGRGWDQDRWEERREPTREDLDRVAPDHPVLLLRNCNHVAIANSAALRLAGITRETPDPAGGRIDRHPVTGEPTGMLREKAAEAVRALVPEVPAARRPALLERAVKEALACGITQVHTDDVLHAGGFEAAQQIFTELTGPDRIPFRVTMMIPGTMAEEAGRRGIGTRAGNQWYRYGQVKLFADGSLGARTAALIDPYSDDPSTRGIFIHEEGAFNEMVAQIHAMGNQVGCHCIGDGAARLFIRAVEAAQARHYRKDHRHRMIHAQIMSELLIQEMRANRIVGDIQPVFLRSDGYWFEDRVGEDRAATSYAWKSMVDRGIALCGGSDCPIEPLNIWYGVHAAVNRQDLNGYPAGGWHPAQRLSVAETLNMYTIGASYATFEEHFKGTLAPGMAADVAILDRDPFDCDPEELMGTQVTTTIVGGRVAYER